MENEIYQILKKHNLTLKKREQVLTDLLLLFSVSGQSEQLKDFAEKVNKYYNGGCGTADELIDKMNKIF
jgi:hypothetical protein